MLKMLIVEDERWEREGLIDFLDWNSLGIELSGLACDGIEGIEKAQVIRPDIIITDIKMPGMDGLKMSRRIREFLPNTKIVILTGYDDFKLAKEAISINANAYILKPVEEDEMLDVLKKVVNECNIDIKRQEEEKKLKELLDESIVSARRDLLSVVLKENVTKETLQQIATLGILPYYNRFAVIAVGLCPQFKSDLPDKGGFIESDMDEVALMLEEMSRGMNFATALYEPVGTITAIVGQSDMSANSLNNTAGSIVDSFREKRRCKAAAGIGVIVESISELHCSCRQAKEALDFSLFWGDRKIVAYTELENLQQDNASSVGEFLAEGNYFIKQLMHSVRATDDERINNLLGEMFLFINTRRWAGRDMIANFLYGLLNETSLLFYNPDLPEMEEGAAGAPLLSLSDFESIKEYVSVFFGKVLGRIKEKRNNKDEYIVKKVEQLIMERYKYDISIKTIAAEIYLSPNYLGSIFKKCTGKPLNDYLCQYRMEKAKELLQSPKYKVSRVAREVGIPNASYFCLLFKNMFGIAPGEYQEMIIRGGL